MTRAWIRTSFQTESCSLPLESLFELNNHCILLCLLYTLVIMWVVVDWLEEKSVSVIKEKEIAKHGKEMRELIGQTKCR